MLGSADGTVGIMTRPDPGPTGDGFMVVYPWDLFNLRAIVQPITHAPQWVMPYISTDLGGVTFVRSELEANAWTSFQAVRGLVSVGDMTGLPIWIPPPDPPSYPRW